MTIARGQMNRQLYGVGSLVDREKFGFGSSLKRFVRKIIPNEVSKVATKVAPIIAPFDPATAAVLSSVGTFDQTGSMSKSLKRGAVTYGGGQLARYIGGAGFQAAPGQTGFQGQSLLSPSAYEGGITAALDPRTSQGLTMPTGTETGIGKLLEGTPSTSEVTGVDKEVYTVGTKEQQAALEQARAAGDLAEAEATRTATVYGSDVPSQVVRTQGPTVTQRVKSIVTGQDPIGNAFELAKSGAKAAFTNKDGSIDKRAVIAAVSGAASYMEARKQAELLGSDITEEEYDEAQKATKKTEYEGYLKDFFGGRKDGGRIPFAEGSDPDDFIKISPDDFKKIMDDFMKDKDLMDELRKKGIMDRDNKKDGGNMGVITRGLPEEAYEQKDQSISYMDPDAKENIFESISTMEPESRMSVIEFMLKSGKMSDDDYNEFMNRLQQGVEEEETRITKQGGGSAYSPEQVLKMRRILFQMDDNPDLLVLDDDEIVDMYMNLERDQKADGGRMGFNMGEGVMSIPVTQNAAGVKELDYRDEGGFVPVGVKERADDVPAMLSKNEFVLTADAVRGIGNGSVETGAKKLYNLMKEAEKVGRGVS